MMISRNKPDKVTILYKVSLMSHENVLKEQLFACDECFEVLSNLCCKLQMFSWDLLPMSRFSYT